MVESKRFAHFSGRGLAHSRTPVGVRSFPERQALRRDSAVKVLVEGAERARVVKYGERTDYYEADAILLAGDAGERVEAEALTRSVVTEFESYVKLNKKVSPEVVGVVQQIEDYAKLADTVASHLAVKIPDKQAILETTKVTDRLEKVLGLMEREISVLRVEKLIRTRVKRQMEKTQRV